MLLIGYRVDTNAIKFFSTGTVVINKYIFWRKSDVKMVTILHTDVVRVHTHTKKLYHLYFCQ